MNSPIELTLEQQFNLCAFETQVNQMSEEQAKEFLVKLYKQMIIVETLYRQFIKTQWGIENVVFEQGK